MNNKEESMKKLLALLLTAIIITACGVTEEPEEIRNADEQEINTEQNNSVVFEDFELTVFTGKQVYKTTDIIDIWAAFKYIGYEEEIKIFHSSEYLVYTIFDGEKYYNEGIVSNILISSVLKKGETELHSFRKSGSWSADEPDAAYWEDFYSQPDLRLPAGEYTITAHVDFSLSENDIIGTRNQFKAELQITVIE
jgi:hypothetical protein